MWDHANKVAALITILGLPCGLYFARLMPIGALLVVFLYLFLLWFFIAFPWKYQQWKPCTNASRTYLRKLLSVSHWTVVIGLLLVVASCTFVEIGRAALPEVFENETGAVVHTFMIQSKPQRLTLQAEKLLVPDAKRTYAAHVFGSAFVAMPIREVVSEMFAPWGMIYSRAALPLFLLFIAAAIALLLTEAVGSVLPTK